MPQPQPKPSVTVLYDAAEVQDREESLEQGEKVPQLVCRQIEAVLTKRGYKVKLLAADDFSIIAPGKVEGNPTLTTFPLIVKPINMDASIGITAKSVVHSIEEMMERVFAFRLDLSPRAKRGAWRGGRRVDVTLRLRPPSRRLGNARRDITPR